MKKYTLTLFLIIFLLIYSNVDIACAADNFRNIFLISWDGAQRGHVIELAKNNLLPNLKILISEGSYTQVLIPPFIKKINETGESQVIENPWAVNPDDEIYYEQAVTDAGHARLLTGKWNRETGIYVQTESEYADFVCGNNLETVNNDLTIMETIKLQRPEVHTAVLSSRHADVRELLSGYDALTGLFKGWADDEIYIRVKVDGQTIMKSHGFYSTTFKNSEEDLDYFFDSFAIPVSQLEDYSDDAYVSVHHNQSGELVGLVELKACLVVEKAIDYLGAQAPDQLSFLFMHFCEPDLFGHVYGVGENTDPGTRYSQAIIEADNALGIFIQGLKDLGLYESSLIIVTTDHGGKNNVSSQIEEIDGKQWLIHGSPFHGSLDIDNHYIWMVNNQYSILPYTVQYPTDIALLILNEYGIESF